MLSAKYVISGTCQSAELAAEALGDARVRVIDSRVTSGGTVILADAIQRRLDRGTDDEEVDAVAERFRRERGLLFTVDTLEYLRRGGRIGAAAALLGGALAVKPLLRIDEGRVVSLDRVRTSARALSRLEDLIVEAAGDQQVELCVSHLANPDRAGELARRWSCRPDGDFRGTHYTALPRVGFTR